MTPENVEAIFAAIGFGLVLLAGFYLTVVRGVILLEVGALVVGLLILAGAFYLGTYL